MLSVWYIEGYAGVEETGCWNMAKKVLEGDRVIHVQSKLAIIWLQWGERCRFHLEVNGRYVGV